MAVELSKSSALQSLSLTPLIDVFCLLLIFFMVTTRFAEEDRELDVKLPTASQAKPMTSKPNDVKLFIDKDGNYYIGSNGPLTQEQFAQDMETLAINNPLTQKVNIQADLKCDWDFVVKAIDTCHKVGLHEVKATAAKDN